MRVLFAGTPPVALPSLRALLASDHDVVGVLTRPPAPAGRRRRLTPSAVHGAATEAGVPVITTNHPHHEEDLAQIMATGAEVAAVVAYGALLREPALSALRHGWVNLHFSILPAWRGAAPVQHAILAGDTRTGVSTFQIEAGLDTGPVLGSKEHEVQPWHTAGDLLAELAGLGAPLLVHTLDEIAAGTARPVPQPPTGITVAPRLGTDDARLDWAEPAVALDRRIRATTPAPGAWTIHRGRRIKIGPVRSHAEAVTIPPGHLLPSAGGVLVGTGSDPVVLGEVAPAGKGWMAASDWARGARLDADSHFESREDA